MKPTPMPDDLRFALHEVLTRLQHDCYMDARAKLMDDRLEDALEVVRCHLAGIARETDEPEVVAEGRHADGEAGGDGR